MSDMLLDTGPFVAFLDRSERNHERCLDFMREFRGRLITTEAVLTEVVYLLGPSFANQKSALDFIILGGAELTALSPALLKRSAALMAKYADSPMDFADATLVALAEERGISDIFTLDRKDFSIYRIGSRKGFTLYPVE
jgi:predicted nucleic acid-binding protein